MRSIRIAGLALLLASLLTAQDSGDIALPAPDTSGGKPLMQVLKARRSSREFAPDKLPVRMLSNLLWAADGINRDDGGRTAPSAHGKQEVEVFVALEQGLFVYEPKGHRLRRVAAGDLRASTGTQDFVAGAPVNLVFVADLAKMAPASADEKARHSAAGAGFISQNVYLYCASEGLATVVRATVKGDALAGPLRLGPERVVVLAQSVGFPKK
jgi:nitroreductase